MRSFLQAEFDRLALVLAQGPAMALDLQRALGISQPTVSRRLQVLGSRIEALGRGRSRRYALRRRVREGGDAWPVYAIGPDGQSSRWGELIALHGGFRLQLDAANAWLERAYPDGFHAGLPFVLQDVAPQGFLGRAIARAVAPLLPVAEDPRDWSDDDRLTFMLQRGHDLPGQLVVGDRMLAQAMRAGMAAADEAVPAAARAARYPQFAEAAMRGERVGSSAGGEQPKFLTSVQDVEGALRPVLVKFSAAEPSPVRQRWMDLLVCEHLAAQVIVRHGVPAVRTELLSGGNRCFLEVTRFDRVGAAGRCGVLSLGALVDGLLDAHCADWIEAAVALGRAGWISPEAGRHLRWLWCFGDLIGNTDMHVGNASLRLTAAPPFTLAPAYDMLPMGFAPDRQGELREPRFEPRPPLPAVADVWPDAAQAAQDFWGAVEREPLVSEAFRGIATSCRREIARWQERAPRQP
jgi:hypothetical protein